MVRSRYTIVTWLSLPIFVSTTHNDWKPLESKFKPLIESNTLPQGGVLTRKMEPLLNSCSLYKTIMDQQNFHQYIQYRHRIPELNEFTLCVWHRLFNYSSDHSLFSYILPHRRRAIFSRIANTSKGSYYTLAVNDHTIYRVNFPIKLFKWYHICQSWNGKTGEWQVWINNERIARGYYNLLVGKPIKSGGIAISGQEFIEYNDVFTHRKKIKMGLKGELTLLQLYKAALSKGKAYSDHRHHHGHDSNKDEEGDDLDDENAFTQTEIPQSLTTEHALLENGQLKPHLPIHELTVKDESKLLYDMHQILPLENHNADVFFKFEKPTPFERHHSRIHHTLGKSDEKKINHINNLITAIKRNDIIDQAFTATEIINIKQTMDNNTSKERQITEFHEKDGMKIKSNQNKRMSTINDEISPSDSFSNSGFLHFYSGTKGDEKAYWSRPTIILEEEIFGQEKFGKLEYEPAEWEVRKIAEMCNACEEDPFSKANVLSWQETPKKLFAGAQYVPSISKCHNF